MNPQEILNRNVQMELGRLVLEIMLLRTNAEVVAQAQKSSPEGEAQGGSVNGAQGADGSRTE